MIKIAFLFSNCQLYVFFTPVNCFLKIVEKTLNRSHKVVFSGTAVLPFSPEKVRGQNRLFNQDFSMVVSSLKHTNSRQPYMRSNKKVGSENSPFVHIQNSNRHFEGCGLCYITTGTFIGLYKD